MLFEILYKFSEHQKRSVAPGIRMFQPSCTVEVKYRNQSELCACGHFDELQVPSLGVFDSIYFEEIIRYHWYCFLW